MDVIADILKTPFICAGWLIVGALAGAIANSIMKSNQPLLTDVILGLIGSVVGGFIVALLGISRPEGGISGVIASLVVAIIGAVVVIGIVRAIRGQRIA